MTDENLPPTQISWSAQTHVGRVRRNNEDAFLGLIFNQEELSYLGKIGSTPMNEHEFLFAVSDGMGGENAGEFASHVVLQTITELISREFNQNPEAKHDQPEALLLQFCQRIHERARAVSHPYEECQGMGATLSLGWFHGRSLHIAHVGDSRIYHLPTTGGMQQLTMDHTVTGRLIREGKLSPREAKTHPHRNQLEKSVGCHREFSEPQILKVPYGPGDRFVLCSDGILDGLFDHGIEKLIRTPPSYVADLAPANRLVKEALEASGRDNLTAMVLQIDAD